MQGIADLQQQITKRINNQSPTKYDMDFYKRKVNRLENDCTGLQDDLNKARIRLRRAEDYQLKYELILKQNNHLTNQLEKREKELCLKKSELETIKIKIEEKGTKNDDYSKEKLQLQRQIEKWKIKAEEAQQKRIAFMFQTRDKSDLNQKREVEGLKKEFIEKEQGYQFQIRQLKKQLNEKQNVEGVISNRVEKIRSQKDEEIRRLQEFIQKQRIANDESYKEKSDEMDKLRDKFQRIFNFQMQNLKKSVDDQDELFNIELNGFRQMISIKNHEISKLLQRVRKETQQHERDRLDMQQENNMYREKIYTVERQNELQINNLKERLTKLHAEELTSIEKRFNSIIEGLKGERKELEKDIREKEKSVEAQKVEYARLKEEMYDRLKERDLKIDQLKQKNKQNTELNENEIKNLHQSFHQIESEKELMTSEYQTNVGFLNQQLSKITVKNDTLNLTIKGLHQQIMRIKKEYTLLIQDIESRWKQERKEYDNERQKEKQKFQKLQDDNRQRDRVFKIKEKQLQRLREKEEREKIKLQFIIQEMERDTERLNNYIKQLDENLKRELKTNQMATLDSGGMRRQLNNELQRQKSQLQAIKRMQVDHLRKKMQIELTRLMGDNQKLEKNLLEKTISLDNLQEEFKRLEHINKNIDRINKEKLIEYQKKMASLNSQINITQTLYNKFLEVKARTGHAK